MPVSGYYRTSMKDAAARTARIKKRQAAAATPEGKAATAKRLLSKRAAREARMTPAERRKAERKRVDAFMRRRNEQMRPDVATPPVKPPPRRPDVAVPPVKPPRSGILGKRTDILEALGQKKKGKK